MREGIFESLDVIGAVTGESEVNAIGYCVGGTLLSIALAYAAAKGDTRIASATLFATQVDFTQAGDLSVFVDEEQIAAVEKKMGVRGYLEGRNMHAAFNMLRPERPHLALRHRQLFQGRAAGALRPALLEFRHDPHAGGQPFLLSAQLLSR